MHKISLLVVVAFTASMIGCGDDNGNGNNGEEFGEAYDDLQGVWVSEEFTSDGFDQQLIRAIDGAEASQELIDPNTGETLFEATYRYEVGDETEATLGGETVSAREIDVKIIEYGQGADPSAEVGEMYYDIFYFTESDGDTVLYFSHDDSEEPENRPDTLADIVYTRQ